MKIELAGGFRDGDTKEIPGVDETRMPHTITMPAAGVILPEGMTADQLRETEVPVDVYEYIGRKSLTLGLPLFRLRRPPK